MLIRIAADLIVNANTTYYFLRGKEVDPQRYDSWKSCHSKSAQRKCESSSSLHKILDAVDEEDARSATDDAGDVDVKVRDTAPTNMNI
jgi:hypothetical protein